MVQNFILKIKKNIKLKSLTQIKDFEKLLKKVMKVVILAGGLGSRLSEYTKLIPKPMVRILKVPIIVRIIKYYNKFGYKDFIIAAGYKSKIIKTYFKKI